MRFEITRRGVKSFIFLALGRAVLGSAVCVPALLLPTLALASPQPITAAAKRTLYSKVLYAASTSIGCRMVSSTKVTLGQLTTKPARRTKIAPNSKAFFTPLRTASVRSLMKKRMPPARFAAFSKNLRKFELNCAKALLPAARSPIVSPTPIPTPMPTPSFPDPNAFPAPLEISSPGSDVELPLAFDTFEPPLKAGYVPSTEAPAVAAWLKDGDPGETIPLTGFQLRGTGGASKAEFRVFGQRTSTNATLHDAEIVSASSDRAMIGLPLDLPPKAAYMVWPASGGRVGRPFMVNATDARWVGPARSEPGAVTAVFGRNLSFEGGNALSWVYLKRPVGGGRWVEVSTVNPYRVEFRVPTDFTAGPYQVWVHNGHAGRFGWSNAGTLTVIDPAPWSARVFDVKNYGAAGNGVADDSAAIEAAVLAARDAPYSTVFFPNGTYRVTRSISLPRFTKIKGASRSRSIIRVSRPYTGFIALMLQENDAQRIEISDLTIDTDGISSAIKLRDARDCKIERVTIRARGGEVADFFSNENVSISEVDVIGGSIFLTGRQVFLDRVNFFGMYDQGVSIHSWGTSDLSVTRSTGRDFDESSSIGQAQGRFFTGNGIWGPSRNNYLADNTTVNFAPRAEVPDQNSGEQFMWEGNHTNALGRLSAATETTADLPGLTGSVLNQELIVTNGKGIGQNRRVTAVSGTRVTVSPPFIVVPDSTSFVTIGNYLANTVLYRNRIDGKARAVTSANHIASSGIQPFGGAVDLLADSNQLSDLRTAFSVWSLGIWADGRPQPNYFNVFQNNTATNLLSGLDITPQVDDPPLPMVYTLGVTLRNNVLTSILRNGIASSEIYALNTTVRAFDLALFEGNYFSDTPLGADLSVEKVGGSVLVFRNNTFVRGTAAVNSSIGLAYRGPQAPLLLRNTFSSFQNVLQNALAPRLLPVKEVINFSGNRSTGMMAFALDLDNAGAGNVAWTVTSTAPWLIPVTDRGSLPDIGTKQAPLFALDPTALPLGINSAMLVFRFGNTERTVLVRFAALS